MRKPSSQVIAGRLPPLLLIRPVLGLQVLESATPNGIHNHVNKRAELEQYDPALYAILKEVLADKPNCRDCYYYE